MDNDLASVSTLLLNSTYEPLKIISWQRAITLLFKNKVEILEMSDVVVHSVHDSLRIPSVLRLRYFVKIRVKHRVKFSKDNVFLRDAYTCQYCGNVFPKNMLTLDHVIPVSLGGKKNWENIVTACHSCNNKKGSRTPELAKMTLLSKPNKPLFIPYYSKISQLSLFPLEWQRYLSYYINV